MIVKNSVTFACEASRQQPCLLCDGEDWCYLINNQQGDSEKIICGRTQPHDTPSGWQHSGTAKDGRPIFINKKVRQAKKRRNRAFPELIQLTPFLKSNIPTWQDIAIPLDHLSPGHTVRLKPGNPGANMLFEVKKITLGKRQGKNCLLAHLVAKGSSGPVLQLEESQIQEIVTSDPETGAKEQFIEYYYSDSLKVVRTQWSDRRCVYPGKKNKKIRPWYKVGEQWVEGKGGREFPLYRFSDATSAIRQGEIVFAVGGEQAVEVLASLGLVATTNQGGEDRCYEIPEALAPIFQEIGILQQQDNAVTETEIPEKAQAETKSELKPLLVIWGDNDSKGCEFATEIAKACGKHRIPHVILEPLTLWSGMPKKGDVKDWVDWCHQQQISESEMLLRLELAIEQAIDFSEIDTDYRWQRSNWNAPTSWKGEIGKWIHKKDSHPVWQPCCNFDFQIERELQDSNGGGLVLQVKRHFEDSSQQQRVILNSTDYTSTEKFVNALKRALSTGICCNLNNFELNQLLAVRLHEYRTSRRGKILKRIECYGQQEDGTWVLGNRQFTKNGQPISEDSSGWVFSQVSAEGDEIPCPELACPNPVALNRLIDAARLFFGSENIHQVLLTIGWVVAGLHSQEIFRDKKWFPLLNMHGEPGSCKTLAAETALSVVGTNWVEKGMVSRASVSAIYEHGSKTGSLPFIWDDPPRNPDTEEIFKTWANRKARLVRGNRQEPKSPLGCDANHVIGSDQAATYTRMVRLPFERASSGDNSAFTQLQEAQKYASGAFPLLLSIGYPKAEIAALEQELLLHLPKAHARIAQALAIVVCYTQKLIQMVGGSEDVKQWAINYLCPTEDDADSAGDSLRDFIAKLQALEAIDEVGDWNKKIVTDKNTGQKFVAIYAANAWKMVDLRFKPATYNEKSLKVLIEKAGGRISGVTLKFAADKAQVIAYYNALITPRLDADGNPIEPQKPRTANRKAWLIPSHLWEEGIINDDYSDDDQSGVNTSTNEYQECDKSENEATATIATNRYQSLVAAETQAESCFSNSSPAATTATNCEIEIKIETNSIEVEEIASSQNFLPCISSVEVAASTPNADRDPVATANLVAVKSHSQLQEEVHQILLCQTWVELVELLEQNTQKLLKAAKQMSKQQRQRLSVLLAEHLRSHPTDLNQLVWLPKKLIERALEKLTFTIQQISGDHINDAKLEQIEGCKFISVNNLGERCRELWVFQSPEGKNIYIYSTHAIMAIDLL